MNLGQLLKTYIAEFDQAGILDARLDAGYLLEHITGVNRLVLPLYAQKEVSQAQQKQLAKLVARRVSGEPLQYILGTQDFMGYTFHVDHNVLVPRADTETLCETVASRIADAKLRVLDIGTGSGALAISLSLLCPNAAVTAVDISAGALGVARKNAASLGACVRFVCSDLFTALEGEQFDVIVSNPPYIRTRDIDLLGENVKNEPHLALDGGEDGLDFYRKIISQAVHYLSDGGLVVFEVGHDQSQDVKNLLTAGYKDVFTVHDLCGIERVVGAIKL